MIGFDPASIALGALPDLLGQFIQNKRNKKAAKQNIRDTLKYDIDTLTKQSDAIISEAKLVTATSGVREQTLEPTLNALLQRSTQELRNRAQRSFERLR